ncbi:hypothetical protein FQR65_LT14619 [Abscondita terminalis]|nr:hypothetical protein FQR65_LT14619 [Abscondita terminalis]
MNARTSIPEFFSGKTIFITGGTGFLGSLLIEKLLRSCPELKRIYVLIRDKKNTLSEKRFDELFESPIFNFLKTNNIAQLQKVVLVKGNIEHDKLGLNKRDWDVIVEEVDCVFHIAASVHFKSPLSQLLLSNVYGTNQMVLLAKQIKNLKVLVYTSSCYSQCTKSVVEEIFYETTESPEDLMAMSKKLGEKFAEHEAISFRGKYPNNYAYSKYLAEDILRRNAQDIPLTIVRPSIVSQVWKEPLEGWTDSFLYLPKGMACYSVGLVHTVTTLPDNCFDLIPADYVVNTIIAAAWSVGTSWNVAGKTTEIYNCSASHQNPLTQGAYESYVRKYEPMYPSNQKMWMRFIIFTLNKHVKKFLYLIHLPQMFLFDAANTLLGRKRIYVELYRKMHSRVQVMTYFLKKSWLFKTENTQKLWDKLDEDDKALFNFDISTLKWDAILRACAKGNDYCNVLKECNSFMAWDTWENSLVRTLIIVEYNKVLAKKDFFEYTKELLETYRSENKIPKQFFTTVYQFMGYLFLRNIKVDLNDIIRPLPMNEDLNEEELLNVIKSYFYVPFPLKGTALWDVYVGTRPLKDFRKNSNPDVEYYPLFFRTHHLLADGINLTKLFMLFFNTAEETSDTNSVRKFELKKLVEKIIQLSCLTITTGVTFLSRAYLFLLHKGHDLNDLHGKPYKHEEIFQVGFDKDGKYFQKVKKIKMMHSTSTFSQILVTAYAASLNEYFQKYSEKCPKNITLALPVLGNKTEIQKVLFSKICTNDVVSTNQFQFLQLELPMDVSKHKQFDKDTPLTSRLNIISQIMNVLQSSNEYQFSYVLIYLILGSLPIWFVKQFGKRIHNTSLGTFIPAPSKLNGHGDVYKLSDCLGFGSHVAQLGIGIAAITFKNQLAIAFNSDSQLKQQSHADEILCNTYRNLDLLEEEIERSRNTN